MADTITPLAAADSSTPAVVPATPAAPATPAPAAVEAPKPAEAAKTAPVELQPFKLPEGREADPVLMGEFSSVAKELGLTQDAGQKLIDLYEKAVGAQQAAWDAQAAKWPEQVKADPDLGGANFDKTKAEVSRVMAKFGTVELRQYLTDTKLGDHPELVRFVAKIGRAMGEDQVGNTSGQGAPEKTLEQIMYGKVDVETPK